MSDSDQFNPLEFFSRLHGHFDQRLSPVRLEVLTDLAFGIWEQATDNLAGDQPDLACGRGCDTCCTLRVLATAPEIFQIAAHIQADPHLSAILPDRIQQANRHTQNLDESQRVALRQPCPMVVSAGECSIYPARPLACRSHVSFDLQQCKDAAGGSAAQVPFSEPHMLVRSLVQNALQSALRDAQLAWGIYELNHGLTLALTIPGAFQQWLNGQDPLAPALVQEIDPQEMAETFDQIKAAWDK